MRSNFSGVVPVYRNFMLMHIVILFFCTSCHSKPDPPLPAKPIPKVEEIKETKTGLASFYSRSLNGERTYYGKIFHNRDMVAAHPTYPLGTVVRVTHLKKGDTVEVRIIDRGPTSQNRKEGVIIDLSRGAAAKIGLLEEGRAPVKVEVLEWGQDGPK